MHKNLNMLYVVGTPIGNLDDISERVLETLEEVDFILSEDTRTTQKLLNHFDINTKLESFHQHSSQDRIDYLLNLLEEGEDLALVTESGTPTISDPGGRLVDQAYEAGFDITPIPGPSALVTAASVSGFPMNDFLFLGFPPKKKRSKFFEKVAGSEYPVIIYESPHRIIKTLNDIRNVVKNNTRIFVGRELTKKFESLYRGKVSEVIQEVKSDPQKGEYTIIVEKG
ncbi:MAG: 16S rRNA (cytidine(1402)-2'-O)-methyltransferase [Candidatus Paceibacterota bacterium]